MEPKQYLEEIVLPTVREFLDKRSDRRRAYLAVIVTNHIKDHFDATFKEIEDQAGDHWIAVNGLCNGAKHHKLDNEKHKFHANAGEDIMRPPAHAGCAVAGLSRVGDEKGGIMIATKTGEQFDVDVSVRTVIKCFKELYPQHFVGIDISDL